MFEFVPVDLARGDLEALTADSDTIFHLAAEPGVRSSWGARYFQYVQNNIMATQHLLDAIKERPDVRFVNASSSSVYGDAEVFPTPESAPTRPRSPYGQTKLSAEHLCSLYRANYGVDRGLAALLHRLRTSATAGHGVPHLLPRGDRGHTGPDLRRRKPDA